MKLGGTLLALLMFAAPAFAFDNPVNHRETRIQNDGYAPIYGVRYCVRPCGDGETLRFKSKDSCMECVPAKPKPKRERHCFPVNCHDCNTCSGGSCTLIGCPTVCDEFCVKGKLRKADDGSK